MPRKVPPPPPDEPEPGCTMGPAGSVDFEDLVTNFSQGGYFVDRDFPADERAIWTDGVRSDFNWVQGAQVTRTNRWLRPHEFPGVTNPALFQDDANDDSGVGGAEANDIKQGPIGNCYFLSALSIMCGCRELDLVPRLFVERRFFDRGLVGVKFFKNGKWWHVAVDTLIPTLDGRSPTFAKNTDINEWWLAIIEKAYAKMHGTYEVLDAGQMDEALVDLTGGAPGSIDVKELFAACKVGGRYDKKKALTVLTERAKGILLQGLGCDGGSEEPIGDGLIAGHAYSINQVREVSTGDVLVQIRNPWATGEWEGKWRDGDPCWTPQLKREVGHTDKDDGMFWMSVDDVGKKFNTLTFVDLPRANMPIYRCESRWGPRTAGGHGKHFKVNPQLLMRVSRKQDITLALSQNDTRMRFSHIHQTPPGTKDDFQNFFDYGWYEDPLLLTVFKSSQRKANLSNVYAKSVFGPFRAVSLTMKDVEPGDYMIVPISEEGVQMDFRVRIFCEYPVELIDSKGGEDFNIYEASHNAITTDVKDTQVQQPNVKISSERETGNELASPMVRGDPRHSKESGVLADIKENALMSSWKVGDFAPSKWEKGKHWYTSDNNRFMANEMCCVMRADQTLRFAKVERDNRDGTYDLITSVTKQELTRNKFVPAKFICKLPHNGLYPVALLNQIYEIFDLIDTDRSGHLDFQFHHERGFSGEMAGHVGKKILMECGVDVEDMNALARELAALDKDGNGLVDRNEVLALCITVMIQQPKKYYRPAAVAIVRGVRVRRTNPARLNTV